MISFGIVDLILILLLVFAIYLSSRRRNLGISILLIAVLITIMVERVAPGTLASIGTAIHGIDSINDAGPHIQIQPIIRFQQ